MKHISQILLLIFIGTLTVSSLHHHEAERYSYDVVLELDDDSNCDLCDVISSNDNAFLKDNKYELFLFFNQENTQKLQTNLGIVSPTYFNLRGPPTYNF